MSEKRKKYDREFGGGLFGSSRSCRVARDVLKRSVLLWVKVSTK